MVAIYTYFEVRCLSDVGLLERSISSQNRPFFLGNKKVVSQL
jgi:hypothetical protein